MAVTSEVENSETSLQKDPTSIQKGPTDEAGPPLRSEDVRVMTVAA